MAKVGGDHPGNIGGEHASSKNSDAAGKRDGGGPGGGGADNKEKVNPDSAARLSTTSVDREVAKTRNKTVDQDLTDAASGVENRGAATSSGGFLDAIGKLFSPTPIFGNPVVDAIFTAMMPTSMSAAIKIGDLMGQQVISDQAAVDAGTMDSTRMDDPSMGRVDDIEGQGIGSLGNAAADDRAPNQNGLGAGTTGGGGGTDTGGASATTDTKPAAATTPAAAPAAEAVSLAPTPNTEIGRLLLDQKRAASQVGGANIMTSGQGLDTNAKTIAQRLFG